MKQVCTDEYWKHMPHIKPNAAPCGRTFDDAEQLTYCPHNPLPPKKTKEELDRLWEMLHDERS